VLGLGAILHGARRLHASQDGIQIARQLPKLAKHAQHAKGTEFASSGAHHTDDTQAFCAQTNQQR